MFVDLLNVFIFASIPIAAIGFILVYGSLSKGYIQLSSDLKKDLKKFDKVDTAQNNDNGDANQENAASISKKNHLVEKWISFGGGFYGAVALLTYIVVEWYEVMDFFTGPDNVFSAITGINVGFFINFFIDSLMNFVTAIAWPPYWLSSLNGEPIWMWFAGAYFGYEVGVRAARIYYAQKVAL